jgi:hypothetical protein
MSCSDVKDQPTRTLGSRTLRRGVRLTVWRVWWRSYGWLRRARAGKQPDRFLARRWQEIEAAYQQQDVVIGAIRQRGYAAPELLDDLHDTLQAEAEAFRMAGWYYQKHDDQPAAFACECWANHVARSPAWQFFIELYRGRPTPFEHGDDA